MPVVPIANEGTDTVRGLETSGSRKVSAHEKVLRKLPSVLVIQMGGLQKILPIHESYLCLLLFNRPPVFVERGPFHSVNLHGFVVFRLFEQAHTTLAPKSEPGATQQVKLSPGAIIIEYRREG
jgi:hypothetical protein